MVHRFAKVASEEAIGSIPEATLQGLDRELLQKEEGLKALEKFEPETLAEIFNHFVSKSAQETMERMIQSFSKEELKEIAQKIPLEQRKIWIQDAIKDNPEIFRENLSKALREKIFRCIKEPSLWQILKNIQETSPDLCNQVVPRLSPAEGARAENHGWSHHTPMQNKAYLEASRILCEDLLKNNEPNALDKEAFRKYLRCLFLSVWFRHRLEATMAGEEAPATAILGALKAHDALLRKTQDLVPPTTFAWTASEKACLENLPHKSQAKLIEQICKAATEHPGQWGVDQPVWLFWFNLCMVGLSCFFTSTASADLLLALAKFLDYPGTSTHTSSPLIFVLLWLVSFGIGCTYQVDLLF